MGKPTHWGSGQIGCLSSLLLFNYSTETQGLPTYQPNTAEGDNNSAVYHVECPQSGTAKNFVSLHESHSQNRYTTHINKSTCMCAFWDRNGLLECITEMN